VASTLNNLLKEAKDDYDNNNVFRASNSIETAGISMFFGLVLMLASYVLRIIYVAFAFKHDAYFYPTLAMLILIVFSYIYTTIKNKFKKKQDDTKELLSEIAEDVSSSSGLDIGLKNLKARVEDRKKEEEKKLKSLEELVTKIKKRTFIQVIVDILYLAYFMYMIYITITG
jgi:uncharacterized membrane protein (DUF485 family)